MTRTCPHCECDSEALVIGHATCPLCGLDPSLPRLAFEDAPAYFLAGDPRLKPIPVAEFVLNHASA